LSLLLLLPWFSLPHHSISFQHRLPLYTGIPALEGGAYLPLTTPNGLDIAGRHPSSIRVYTYMPAPRLAHTTRLWKTLTHTYRLPWRVAFIQITSAAYSPAGRDNAVGVFGTVHARALPRAALADILNAADSRAETVLGSSPDPERRYAGALTGASLMFIATDI